MGLFKRKPKEVRKEIPGVSQLPELPKLPKLPELPGLEEKNIPASPIHRLPGYPSNSLGEKFSQDTIKEAVTGKREADIGFGEDEFAPLKEERRIPKPVRTPMGMEFGQTPRKAEPVFIRLDKFEESLKIFGKVKRQISDIEHILSDIKKIKEEEDRELGNWEREVQSVKEQIKKIDRDIFSKI